MNKKQIIIFAVVIVAGLAVYFFAPKNVPIDSGSLPPETKPVAVACSPKQRNADVCTEEYAPVCATVNIQCIRAPCNPIRKTFSNSCEACKNSLASSYTAGECSGGVSPSDSGVTGKVLLGPTCPVLRDPPDPRCAEKPYQTTIEIVTTINPRNMLFTKITTDEHGQFKALLPPGKYALQPIGGKPFPRCGAKEVTITTSEMQTVYLSCDTGIR